MTPGDLPDPHVRLIFAVMLWQAGLIDASGFRAEVVSAFGPIAGEAIADRLLSSSATPAT